MSQGADMSHGARHVGSLDAASALAASQGYDEDPAAGQRFGDGFVSAVELWEMARKRKDTPGAKNYAHLCT